MFLRRRTAAALVAALGTIASLLGLTAPAASAAATPFISEIHYDNAGADLGEAIEVQAEPGTDLTGWTIELLNGGSNPAGASYSTRTLTATVGAEGVHVETWPQDGIQNGDPDAVALVDPDGEVVELLSYGGTFTVAATNRFQGLATTDLGVKELSSTPVGQSLQRIDGTWTGPAPASFGAVNAPPAEPEPGACVVDAATHTIAEVQGTGDATPIPPTATVTVEGVVTADWRAGNVNGMAIQTPGTGGAGRPVAAGTASDGIFVYFGTDPSGQPPIAIGDAVQVTGSVVEFGGQTQIATASSAATGICATDQAVPEPTPLALPLDAAARESAEGMLVAPAGPYTVSDTYQSDSFGQVFLAAGEDRARIPTDLARPGSAEALAARADNEARRILLDDASNLNLVSAGQQPPYYGPDSPLRVGDRVEAFGPLVLGYGFDHWRLQPTTLVTAATPAAERTRFRADNPRTTAPNDVGGDLRVASFNVLNFFVNYGGDARGAADEAAMIRQRDKIVAAITTLDADVVALQEIENSVRFPNGGQDALVQLVAALNAADGAGTWAHVATPAEMPPASAQDVIASAIIYKPAAVEPVGASRTVDDETVWHNAREPIGQTFRAGEATVTVIANHLKSKSTSSAATGDNADTGDGQGAFNGDRRRQAASVLALADEMATAAGSDEVLLLGDFNSYTFEDPMQVFYDDGLVALDHEHGAAPTYVFSGESGTLDHAVATPALAERVTGIDVWEINATEAYPFQYDANPAFYAPDPYRASDHNPVVIGLDTGGEVEPTGPVDLQILTINDFHGRLESPGNDAEDRPIGGAAQLAGLVGRLRGENPYTSFVSAGDNIGASAFVSAIQDDTPTLDVLNHLGLEVSAVGNHEFDKGFDDLSGRVTDQAEFPYLGANVYRDGARVLPAYEVVTHGGVDIGYVGVVTQETPSLVAPDGIAGLEFRDPVAEAEAVAADLSDGSDANGEADVVVLLVHEGAPAESIDSAEDLEGDPVFGPIMDVSDDVDAIVSGHTHQPYAFVATKPNGEPRPVLQAEDYGKRIGRITLTVDPATGEIEDPTAELVPVVGVTPDPTVADMVAGYKAEADVLGEVEIGSITADALRARTPSGGEDRGSESVLGNLVADAQLHGTRAPERGGAQLALMNAGGLREDLLYAPDGIVTYGEAFAVQPFANDVVTKTYTGAELKQVLEEQWQPTGASRPVLWLGVSQGFTYEYDSSRARGERVDASSMRLDGEPIDPAGTYRVAINAFLASGGDNFATLAGGTDRKATGDNDLILLRDYFEANSPVTPDTAERTHEVPRTFETVEEQVTAQFRDVAGRNPDPLELAAWSLAIEAGTRSVEQLVVQLLTVDPSGVDARVIRLYDAFFKRVPDAAGFDHWTGRLRAGRPLKVAADTFARSAEFRNRYGSLSNAAFVDLVYENVLGRAPDPAGRAHWIDQLARTARTRGEVMAQFAESAENRRRTVPLLQVVELHRSLLRRLPRTAEATVAVDALRDGSASLEDLVAEIQAGVEYRSRFT